MNKKLKWGLVALILVATAAWGVYSQLPKVGLYVWQLLWLLLRPCGRQAEAR